MHLPSLLFGLAAFATIVAAVSASRTVYTAEDITAITLYSSSAVYLPAKCPRTIEFAARARQLPELSEDKIGIFPRDIIVNGNRCKSDTLMLDFTPLGPTDHYPPQWIFEDSRFHGFPVNFTCGDTSFSIRFGYFNDVSTEETGGFLKTDVVFLDFAVIPNTKPFGFCSYAGRRSDGERPLDFAPFPTRRTWESFHELRRNTHPDPSNTDGVDVSPQPEESMEAEDPDMESGNTNTQDAGLNSGQMDEDSAQETEAPGLDRAASMDDPFRS